MVVMMEGPSSGSMIRSEDGILVAAVDHGRLVQLLGQAADELHHHVDEEGPAQVLGQDQRHEGAHQAQPVPDDVLGDHQHLAGQQHGHDHGGEPELAALEVDPGQRVGHHGRGDHRAQRAQHGDDDGVFEVGAEGQAAAAPPAVGIVLEHPFGGQEGHVVAEDLALHLEGREDHPQYGVDHQQPEGDDEQVVDHVYSAFLCHARHLSSRRTSSGTRS